MTSIPVKKALNALLRDPGNAKCADCKTQQHPRWASWSLGVFICIRCAGIHRSLGTHISKVKSVDLDTWKEEHLSMLVKMRNNDLANEYYENGLMHDAESQSKMNRMLLDTNKLSVFIRNKYEYKKWVGQEKTMVKDSSENIGTKAIPSSSSSSSSLSISDNVEGNTSDKSIPIRKNDKIHHPYLKLNQIGTQSQPNIMPYNNNNRPDLKKSILSLYSKPRNKSSIGMSSMTVPSLGNSSFQLNNITSMNNNNNTSDNNTNKSTISLDDNELFKNVWQ